MTFPKLYLKGWHEPTKKETEESRTISEEWHLNSQEGLIYAKKKGGEGVSGHTCTRLTSWETVAASASTFLPAFLFIWGTTWGSDAEAPPVALSVDPLLILVLLAWVDFFFNQAPVNDLLLMIEGLSSSLELARSGQ